MLRAKIDFPRYHLNSRISGHSFRCNVRQTVCPTLSSGKQLPGDHPIHRCMLTPNACSLKTAKERNLPILAFVFAKIPHFPKSVNGESCENRSFNMKILLFLHEGERNPMFKLDAFPYLAYNIQNFD